MKYLVFLLEEPSAKDLLEGLLPRLLPAGVYVQYLVFEGKYDLEKQIVGKMKGWLIPDSAFIVIRDQDAADCKSVKARLTTLVKSSGRSPVLIRIACKELESWIVGDWAAVAMAFEMPGLKALAVKEPNRDPDQLVRPVEALRAQIPEYQKRDGARRVGPHLDPARNQSKSFRALVTGLEKLLHGFLGD